MPKGKMIMTELMQQTLYINSQYDNEGSLNQTIDSEVDSFSDITYRTLISEVKNDEIDNNEILEEEYGISLDELDNQMSSEHFDKYMYDISFYIDNCSGGSALAFDLIGSLKKFTTDQDGNGSHHGVELLQTRANGPRKYVFITNQEAEKWLIEQFNAEGHSVKIVRVD
ncbi:MAG TPA: hypothetical protein DCR48_05360 [Flavobacteriales bacterium]|nr:hypothetical protein [Flavobacteriales bacterium]|tara:strand:- start:710 stop:1216 length:507 start_codon:yes stop_codon:yes gene_type:complete